MHAYQSLRSDCRVWNFRWLKQRLSSLILNFCCANFLNRMKSQWLIVYSQSLQWEFVHKDFAYTSVFKSYTYYILSRFSASVSIFRFLIHLDFGLVHGDRYGSSLIFDLSEASSFQHHLHCFWWCEKLKGSKFKKIWWNRKKMFKQEGGLWWKEEERKWGKKNRSKKCKQNFCK